MSMAYARDPRLCSMRVEVLRTDHESDGKPFVVLRDTLFYPEGGGQPADHGTIADACVLDVQQLRGEIRHYLDRPIALGEHDARLDWMRRFDLMQQHTAQHLLSAVAQDQFGWTTGAFHLGDLRADIELDTPALDDQALARLADAVAEEVRRARPVRERLVSVEEYAALEVRSRGLPEGHRGAVRLIEIEGIDLSNCGGTHLQNTCEIEFVHLLATEPMRGGTRLYFFAGSRARRHAQSRERLVSELRKSLGVGEHEFLTTLALRQEQVRETSRTLQRLETELVASWADTLAKQPRLLLEFDRVCDSPAQAQLLAKLLQSKAPQSVSLVRFQADGALGLVLAAGEQVTGDVQALGRQFLAKCNGRGGGAGRLVQGKLGASFDWPQAVSWLEQQLGAQPA
jgi:alanyl-tRNA synthetase